MFARVLGTSRPKYGRIVAAKQPVREAPQRAVVAAEETPYVITKTSVPLLPAVSNKTANLVQPGGIPSFSDYLCPGKIWIRFNIQEDGGIGHHMSARIACEDRSEIKTETIHMHLFHPIADAIQNHPANDGMIGVEGVSSTAIIGIARAVFFQDVISVVVESTKTESWYRLVAFRCMIENNVKD